MNPIAAHIGQHDFPPLAQIRKTLRIPWYRCAIERETLRELTRADDVRGLAQSLGHLGLWVVTGSVMGVVDGQTARDFVAALETRANFLRFRRLKLLRGKTPKKVRVEVEVEAFYKQAGR